MALLNVLLPEPFGPMMACTSPLGTSSVRPRMISFSPIRTCRFWIFSKLMILSKKAILFASVSGGLLRVRGRALRAQAAEGNFVLQNGDVVRQIPDVLRLAMRPQR